MRELKTMAANNRRVLVTGGGAFLGDAITAALLAEGAEVTLLVRPGG
jgi:NAD(P)-dependent dehydrogenase (short-subunit alcohol dehydrogenase family)